MIASWRHTVTYTTEYLVPINAPIGEFFKAYNHAWSRFCTSIGSDAEQESPRDDWARITADDEHVIIRFETAKPLDATAGREGEQR